jgi:hypothetical protein
MKKSAILIVFVVLCFVTCKKEGSQENLCYSNTLISQINSGDQAIHGLTYNSNCLVYESMEPYEYKKYFYDDQNRLQRIEVALTFNASFSCVAIPNQSLESDPRKAKIGGYYEFEYDDSQRLIKKSYNIFFNGSPALASYDTFDYENNQISKLSSFNAQGLLTDYHKYKYDNNGNMIRDDLYIVSNGTKLYQTNLYEFDNKNNPYQIFAKEGDPGRNANMNNIVSETNIYYYGTTESRNTRQNVYKYNDLDYPVRINSWDCIYGKLK